MSKPIDSAVRRASMMMRRARWAVSEFSTYDQAAVARIVTAATDAAFVRAEELAHEEFAETGFGVTADKVVKNQMGTRGIVDFYLDADLVSPRIDAESKIVEIPQPAGVIFGLTPSTQAVSTVTFKIILALMTRNAVVLSPHPAAKGVCVHTARIMAEAAEAAGAPDGVIQVVEEPSVPLIEALMSDENTDVVVATGGGAVVRAAYRSGNPAIGVGPGNCPVLVDRTADVERAAAQIVDSVAFDHAVQCTAESTVVAEEAIADRLLAAMTRAGAHVCDEDETERIRQYLYPDGAYNAETVGKSAAWVAERAGVRVARTTRVLVTPYPLVVPEEVLTHEKLCPVLGFTRVASADRGIRTAVSLLRVTGAGHSAAVHSADPTTVVRLAAAVPALRVSVNVGNSAGAGGFDTALAPSMTIGTGFYGKSSLGENLRPDHLVTWTRAAYANDAGDFPDFSTIDPWERREAPAAPAAPTGSEDDLRAEIRRLILEEIQDLVRG